MEKLKEILDTIELYYLSKDYEEMDLWIKVMQKELSKLNLKSFDINK